MQLTTVVINGIADVQMEKLSKTSAATDDAEVGNVVVVSPSN